MSAFELAGRSPRRSGRQALADNWRSFRTAVKLGWQTEANWADPVLFAIYSVAKPVGAALILVFMVDIISAGRADPALRAFVVIGVALWTFVMTGIAGLAWSILDDRERYRMLKYLYVSPNPMILLLLGRGTARIGIGAFGALITLVIGVLFLGVPFDLTRIDWTLALASMAVGLVGVLAIGVILAAISMQLRQDAWHYPEAVAGALFLLVGAVFPLLVLPSAVQFVGLLLPLTWWLEGVRQAVFPGAVSSVGGEGSLYSSLTGNAAPASAEILLALIVTTVLALAAAVTVFRWSEHSAKEKGVFDMVTGS